MDKEARVRKIVVFALAYNTINRNGACQLRSDGKGRFVSAVTAFVENYESIIGVVRATSAWKEFLELHCQFALTLRDGVFVGRGPETTRDLLLSLLLQEGFLPLGEQQVLQANDLLLEGLRDGNTDVMTAAIFDNYTHPN